MLVIAIIIFFVAILCEYDYIKSVRDERIPNQISLCKSQYSASTIISKARY